MSTSGQPLIVILVHWIWPSEKILNLHGIDTRLDFLDRLMDPDTQVEMIWTEQGNNIAPVSCKLLYQLASFFFNNRS